MKKVIIILGLLLGIVAVVSAQKITDRNGMLRISEIPSADLPMYQKLSDALHTIIIYQKMVREGLEADPKYFCGNVKKYGEVKKIKDRQSKIRTKKFCRYSSAKSLECAKADFDRVLSECSNSRIGFYMLWHKYQALDKLTRDETKKYNELQRVIKDLCNS